MKMIGGDGDRAREDPERSAAIRQSLRWLWLSYVPVLAGIGWLVFAVRQWAGQRGVFLGISGVILGLVASAGIFYPFLRVTASGRRIAGVSVGTYTLVAAVLGVAIAVVLAVLAFALAQT